MSLVLVRLRNKLQFLTIPNELKAAKTSIFTNTHALTNWLTRIRCLYLVNNISQCIIVCYIICHTICFSHTRRTFSQTIHVYLKIKINAYFTVISSYLHKYIFLSITAFNIYFLIQRVLVMFNIDSIWIVFDTLNHNNKNRIKILTDKK